MIAKWPKWLSIKMSPKAKSLTLKKKNYTKNYWFMTSCMSSCNWIYFSSTSETQVCVFLKDLTLQMSRVVWTGTKLISDSLKTKWLSWNWTKNWSVMLSMVYSAMNVLKVHLESICRVNLFLSTHLPMSRPHRISQAFQSGLWYSCLQIMTKEEPRNQIQVQVHQWIDGPI